MKIRESKLFPVLTFTIGGLFTLILMFGTADMALSYFASVSLLMVIGYPIIIIYLLIKMSRYDHSKLKMEEKIVCPKAQQ